ncbi:MAG: hypothetical protein LBU53_08735 [Zoogloeaceae bacterium]|jgi:hypothetical protein|nr:hypothetical protein [Zoogloeaceae bacterium]
MNTVHHLSPFNFSAPSAAAMPVAAGEADVDEQIPAASGEKTTSAPPSTVVQISMESLRLMRQEAVAPVKEEKKNESLELYAQYEHRLNSFMRRFFTQDDKELLGEAYKLAERKNRDLKKIDKLANELGSLRIRQFMAGELVLAAAGQEQDENAPRQPDLAHMAILGEMKKMAG